MRRLSSFPATLISRFERILALDLKYILHGNVWLTITQVVANLSGMMLTIAFANLLSPTSYGFFKYIISLTGVFNAFTLSGIGTALINTIARGDDGILRATFWDTVRWNLPVSVFSLIVGAYYLVHGNFAISASLAMFAICNPWISSFGNYRHFFSGKKNFRMGMFYSIPRSVLPILLILAAIVLTDNPVVVIFAYFIANTATVILLYILTIRRYHLPKKTAAHDSTLTFAKKTSILAIFTQIAGQIDQLLVWHFMGPVAVAIYSLATSPVEQVQSLTGNIFALAAPKFALKSEEEIRHTVPKRILQMFLIVLPITILYILAVPWLFKFLFPKYLSAVFYTQIFALVLLLQPQGFIDVAFVAQENVGMRAKVQAAGQVVRIILLSIGIWRWGILGGIVATIISEVITLIVGLFVLQVRRRKLT